MISYSQELILPDNLKQYYKLYEDINGPSTYYILYKDIEIIPNLLEKYDSLFKIGNIEVGSNYWKYADLLAQSGNLEKAVEYYEKSMILKNMSVEAFDQRKNYFEKDTVLYNQKKKEFAEKYIRLYTERELNLRLDIKEMFAADQFARYYDRDFPKYKNCSKNIIAYVDSITMIKLVELLEKYSEYSNPLSVDGVATFIIGRHIFTGYPEFWLTYFEPKEREALLNMDGLTPTEYARTYDRCIITSGREKYSYYGEWDDNGKFVNPDKDIVNKRRANLGLLPLGEKKDNSMQFFITY